jgi:hypothetical protein
VLSRENITSVKSLVDNKPLDVVSDPLVERLKRHLKQSEATEIALGESKDGLGRTTKRAPKSSDQPFKVMATLNE